MNETQSTNDLWDLSVLDIDTVFKKYGLDELAEQVKKEQDKNKEIGLVIQEKDKKAAEEEPFYEKMMKGAESVRKGIEKLKAEKKALEDEGKDIAQLNERAKQLMTEAERLKAEGEQKAKELEYGRAEWFSGSGVTFDYKTFMIDGLAKINHDNKKIFDSEGKPAVDVANDVISAAIRSRAREAFDEMSYQAKKIIDPNWQKYFERNGEKGVAILLDKATNHELDVKANGLLSVFERIDQFGWDKMDPKYKKLVLDLYQYAKNGQVFDSVQRNYVTTNPDEVLLGEKDLGRGDQIRRGVKDAIVWGVEKRDFSDTYKFAVNQVKIYDDEIKRLQANRLFKDKKRQKMLEDEKKKLENNVIPKLKNLIQYQGAEAPTAAIKSYLSDVRMICEEDRENMAGFMDWMAKQLDARGIDSKNENVTIEIEYVPLVQDVGGKKMAYDIHAGGCALKVKEKKGMTNEVQFIGEINAPQIYTEIPKEFYKSVVYLGLVKGDFYTKIKGD